jgi:nucleotide-binding universal stress UspA family protein
VLYLFKTITAMSVTGLSMFKTVLLPVDQSDVMRSVMETCWLAADRFQATIEGVALRPAFAEIVAPDPIVAVTIPPADWNEVEFCRKTRAQFDEFAAEHPAPAGAGARFRWRGGSAIEDGAIGSIARVFDLSVLGRPGRGASRMAAFESALFDSGRPVLMAPPRALKTLGDVVLVHWNRSTETARALAFALPFLAKAKQIMVLTVEGATVPGPSGKDACGYLAAHGIGATEKSIAPRNQRPGETILAEASALGADLLIKGAYTQSRLRQMIFGGPTSHIIAAAELPVLFAH